MEKIKDNKIVSNMNFDKFTTAMVGIRYSDARQDVENSNASAEEYKILSLNLMDEATKGNTDDINKVCNIVDKWVLELKPCEWQEELVEFCESKADIAQAFVVSNNDKQDFVIIMDDSTIDDNVLDYNGFGFDMLKKYKELNDFMVLDVYSSESIQYMYDKVEEIYKRG